MAWKTRTSSRVRRQQAAEGLRLHQEWSDRRAARIERGSVPSFRTTTAETLGRDAGAPIPVETITLPIAPGRPGGRKFGRLVHDILQHAVADEDMESLAAIWGRRHGAADFERTAAVEWRARPWRTPRWQCRRSAGAIANSL